MKKLIIIAQPNKTGFSHIMAQEFHKSAKDAGHEVQLLDLYSAERKQDYLQLSDTNQFLDDPKRHEIQHLIRRADEIEFFFPVWWFDAPAILKNFLDTNMTSGFAYKHTGGFMPTKLLQDKKARLFITAGAPRRAFYFVILPPLRIMWTLGRLGYVGINLRSITGFPGMGNYKNLTSRLWMLERVQTIAKKS